MKDGDNFKYLGPVRPALTPRETELYRLLQASLVWRGQMPTKKELSRRMGFQDVTGVHQLLKGLEAKGFVRLKSHATPGVELVQ